MRDKTGKKIVNMVCDKCHGILWQFVDGEIQLQHEIGCPNKWREDTFLLSFTYAPSKFGITSMSYPTHPNAKLNPDIHQRFWDGEITQEQAIYQNEALQIGATT